MNQIEPYPVWVGHAGDSRAFKEIFFKEIRAVVQLAAEEPAVQPPRDLILFRFPLLDGTGNDLEVLRLAIDSIATLLKMGISTLVCCGAGMSRSPAVVAAALSVSQKLELDDCMKRVAEFRPVDLSPGFWSEVVQSMRMKGCDLFDGRE